MRDPSRTFRWTLLAASLVTIGFLLAAAVRENYLAQWQAVQREYRTLLEEKADDDRGRELLENFRIELKQVAVPALNAVDRCVTCHNGIDDPRMVGQPQPHAVHPGDILTDHPVDRFGCTICHHGQGPATNFRDAKAEDAFWDYPLLTAKLTQSSCLTCHDVRKLPEKQVALVLAGMRLYREKSCGSCHKLKGRGGILGPALDNEGAKTKHQLVLANLQTPHTTWRWHQAHFRDPGGIVQASLMKNPTVTEPEALALTVYMLSLWDRDVPESYLAPDKIEQKFRELNPVPLTGEEVYRQYCFACHGDGRYGRWDKIFNRFIPAIRGPSLLATASDDYLKANITAGRPGTQMPAWGEQAGGLLSEEIEAVVEYLRTGAAPAKAALTSVVLGDANRGAVLFVQNCAGCHGGESRVAPNLASKVLNDAASDAFLATTIRNGRQGTAMPAFQRPGVKGLTDSDIGDLVAFIRASGRGESHTPLMQASNQSGNKGGGR